MAPDPVATSRAVTRDVCEQDFPPKVYGRTPAEVEQTVASVVERIFRDEDGAIRSGVHGRTMRPLTPGDIHDCPEGKGTLAEYALCPPVYRPLWLNYENMMEASGKYLTALIQKHRVTREDALLPLARQTFEAFRLLWDNTAEQHGYGRGWMPKPYAGLRDVADMHGSSVDQYTDVTISLYHFYNYAADSDEKTVIENMILSFADWWIDRDYTCAHLGSPCQWRRGNPPLATAYFLYLMTLCERFNPCRKYRDAFDQWMETNRNLYLDRDKRPWLTTAALVLELLEQLVELRPDYRPLWMRAAEVGAEHTKKLIGAAPNAEAHSWNVIQSNSFAAYALAIAHDLMPDRNHDQIAWRCLERSQNRADFYHLRRGLELDDVPLRLRHDDYRNTFWAEQHIAWLHAYWRLRGSATR